MGESEFDGVLGLKQLLIHRKELIAYNFAKKFFEFANGYEPSLQDRVALLELTRSGDCRMGDLVVDVLRYSFEGELP